jgi:hypothetical protein
MSGVRGMKQRRRRDGQLIRRDPFDTARELGRCAAAEGRPTTACPYRDFRKNDGRLTFSRAWRNAWFEGYRAFASRGKIPCDYRG